MTETAVFCVTCEHMTETCSDVVCCVALQRSTCLFKGECPISVQTRRFCPACRLQKCFTVGMKADLILGKIEQWQF